MKSKETVLLKRCDYALVNASYHSKSLLLVAERKQSEDANLNFLFSRLSHHKVISSIRLSIRFTM
jgi:hypothetical protein